MGRLAKGLAVGVFGAFVLTGVDHPRDALAIDGAVQNPANGHFYKRFTDVLPWHQAKSAAAAIGGYLATVTSSAEDQWLAANFTVGGTWLGATDEVTEGTWVWVTGETWTYTNWQSGEPNDSSGAENYLEYQGGSNQWNDAPANDPDGYLVEWDSDPNGPPPTPDPPAAPSNLDGSVSVGNPIRLTWTDNSGDETAFEVERRTAETPFGRVAETGANLTLLEDSGTAPDTDYTYRVRAKNSAGASGYSNEETVRSSAIAPAPKAPSLLVVVQATTGSIELQWKDNSLDEVAFEVLRKPPGGTFAFVGSTPSESTNFTDPGLPPDTAFVYGVRSVNAYRSSSAVEVAAATLPTLSVFAIRGDLKDSPKTLKDSIKVWAEFDFLPEASDGLFDPVVEGLSLRVGTVAAPVLMLVPPNMDGWKVAKGKATWKSPKGSTPKYKFEVLLETRLVKVTVTGLELAVPPANPVRVSLGVGNDAGTDIGDWDASKPGVLKLR